MQDRRCVIEERKELGTVPEGQCLDIYRKRCMCQCGFHFHVSPSTNMIHPGTSVSSYMDSRYASLVIPDNHLVNILTDCDGFHMLTHLNRSLRPDPFHHIAKHIQGIARPSPTLDHAKPEESQALQVRKDDFTITAQAPGRQETLPSSRSNEGQSAERENKNDQTLDEFNPPYGHSWSMW